MAFRRTTDLPCRISKTVSLRLHPEIYDLLQIEAGERTLVNGRRISIGDVIREIIKETVPEESLTGDGKELSNDSSSAPRGQDYCQLVFAI